MQMHYENNNFNLNVLFLKLLCLYGHDSYDLKLFMIGIAMRFIEQPYSEDNCNENLIAVLGLVLGEIEKVDTSTFCISGSISGQISLFDHLLVGFLSTLYSINQNTWVNVEVILWKFICGSMKVHVWKFSIELISVLAEKGNLFKI